MAALLVLATPVATLAVDPLHPGDADEFTPVDLSCITMGVELAGGITQENPTVFGNYLQANVVESNTIWYRTALAVWNPTRRTVDWVTGYWEPWLSATVLSGDPNEGKLFDSYPAGHESEALTWNLNRPADHSQWFITLSELYWPAVEGGYSKRAFWSNWIQC